MAYTKKRNLNDIQALYLRGINDQTNGKSAEEVAKEQNEFFEQNVVDGHIKSAEERAEEEAIKHAKEIEEQNQANQETQWEREDSSLQRKVRDGQALGLNPLASLGATGASSTTGTIENTMSEALMNQASGIHSRKAEKAQRIMSGVEMALGTLGKVGQLGIDAYDKKWKREHDVDAMKIDLLRGFANGITGQKFANMSPQEIGSSLGEWISTQAMNVFGAKPTPNKNKDGPTYDDGTPIKTGKDYQDDTKYGDKKNWLKQHGYGKTFTLDGYFKFGDKFYPISSIKFTKAHKVMLFDDNNNPHYLGDW